MQMDDKFKKQFPTRKELEIVSSTREWKKNDNAARIIQRFFRHYVRDGHSFGERIDIQTQTGTNNKTSKTHYENGRVRTNPYRNESSSGLDWKTHSLPSLGHVSCSEFESSGEDIEDKEIPLQRHKKTLGKQLHRRDEMMMGSDEEHDDIDDRLGDVIDNDDDEEGDEDEDEDGDDYDDRRRKHDRPIFSSFHYSDDRKSRDPSLKITRFYPSSKSVSHYDVRHFVSKPHRYDSEVVVLRGSKGPPSQSIVKRYSNPIPSIQPYLSRYSSSLESAELPETVLRRGQYYPARQRPLSHSRPQIWDPLYPTHPPKSKDDHRLKYVISETEYRIRTEEEELMHKRNLEDVKNAAKDSNKLKRDDGNGTDKLISKVKRSEPQRQTIKRQARAEHPPTQSEDAFDDEGLFHFDAKELRFIQQTPNNK